MRVGGGEALCQIGSRGGSGGAHARWGLRAGGLRGNGEGDRDRDRAVGSAPSRAFRSRPALRCRPARSIPPPRCPCSLLAMCGVSGFEARVPPTVCSSLLVSVSPPCCGSGSVCHPQRGHVSGWARLPGEFGGCEGGGLAGCPCPGWSWGFFLWHFGQRLGKFPEDFRLRRFRGSALGKVVWVLAALRSRGA